MNYLSIALVTVLGLVFGVSAFSKARSADARRAFASSLREWRLLPVRFVVPVAAMVTGAEIVIGLALYAALAVTLFRGDPRVVAVPALALAAVLLIVLTAGIALALRRGTRATCACFGPGRPLRRVHLLRNLLLLLVAVGGIVGVTGGSAATVPPASAALSLFAGAVVGLLLTGIDDLVDLFSGRRIPRSSTSRS